MAYLGIDIGTTNCKIGLFAEDGTELAVANSPTPSQQGKYGSSYLPDKLWDGLVSSLKELLESNNAPPIKVIGITSMAETGLLVDGVSGEPRSEMIPWYDKRAMDELRWLTTNYSPYHRFCITGLHPNFKGALLKLLWIKRKDPAALVNSIWLSTADYIGYRLTGNFGTDYTLAARSYCFSLDTYTWDAPFLEKLGLSAKLFPEASASGSLLGELCCLELPELNGVPVAICGQDHICAMVGVGGNKPGVIVDSMGTAETLMGVIAQTPLEERHYQAGFAFGPHVFKGQYFWMGGLSSSGGSVEWLRRQLSTNQLSYEEVLSLLEEGPQEPTEILYFPFLAGRGSPNSDPNARAAFVGLSAPHGKGDLLRAVLEGTAYEMEWMRQAACDSANQQAKKIIVVGGGTKNPYWLQIKADVFGCQLAVSAIKEGTTWGAAIVAAIGCGIITKQQAETILAGLPAESIAPNLKNYQKYQILFNEGYRKLMDPLKSYYHALIGEE